MRVEGETIGLISQTSGNAQSQRLMDTRGGHDGCINTPYRYHGLVLAIHYAHLPAADVEAASDGGLKAQAHR